MVNYNPNPWILFTNIFKETWQTLIALFSGSLSPKWLSGPVGIVQVMQHGLTIGLNEALFWVAAISINLGFLNLLPIPVLDGGYIVLCLVEMISGKKIKPKTMEKIILPFMILLIGFIIFVTYWDIIRLF
jgi:regulator of sigma E protease